MDYQDRNHKKGIWKNEKLLTMFKYDEVISLGEGSTPIGAVEGIFFKHEYQNPTGSIKDRGMTVQVSHISKNGAGDAVISSSGNAAISAASYCQKAGIRLKVFVSPHINAFKLERIRALGAEIIIDRKPVSKAFRDAKERGIPNLRQSTDPYSLSGFRTLGTEILEDNRDFDAIFMPVSSGTAILGLFEGLKAEGKMIPLHCVQTEKIHPIASYFDACFEKSETSIADAIVAKYALLKDRIVDGIKESRGFGWVISDGEIEKANEWLRKRKIICSNEGGLALAGFFKSQKNGMKINNPLIILTGKYYG